MSKLEIAITTHHDPYTDTAAKVERWIRNPVDADVTIVQNGSREATVTLNLTDDVLELLDSGRNDYLYRLYVKYQGVPVIWAPLVSEWDADDDKPGTAVLIARDTDRLENHYLRNGDASLDTPITADYQGMRLIRDAANNTAAQTARGVIPLGIKNGTDDRGTRALALVSFSRWDQVLSSMQQLARGTFDWELEVLDLAEVDTYDYMALNTFAQQGTDRSTGPDAIVFQDNYGLRNITGHHAVPDKFLTHFHAHGDADSSRETAYDAQSSRFRGIYVGEEAAQYQGANSTELAAAAKAQIKAFGLPTHTFAFTLLPEVEQHHLVLVDYGIGDRVRAGVKKGYYNREDVVKIVGIHLLQDGRAPVRADLTVVNEIVVDADIGTSEET